MTITTNDLKEMSTNAYIIQVIYRWGMYTVKFDNIPITLKSRNIITRFRKAIENTHECVMYNAYHKSVYIANSINSKGMNYATCASYLKSCKDLTIFGHKVPYEVFIKYFTLNAPYTQYSVYRIHGEYDYYLYHRNDYIVLAIVENNGSRQATSIVYIYPYGVWFNALISMTIYTDGEYKDHDKKLRDILPGIKNTTNQEVDL